MNLGRNIVATLRLQDDLLKQASDRIVELEHELAFAHEQVRLLELRLQRRPRLVDSTLPALLRRQAE